MEDSGPFSRGSAIGITDVDRLRGDEGKNLAFWLGAAQFRQDVGLEEPTRRHKVTSRTAFSVPGSSSGSVSAITVMAGLNHRLSCVASFSIRLIHSVADQLGCAGAAVRRAKHQEQASQRDAIAKYAVAERSLIVCLPLRQRRSFLYEGIPAVGRSALSKLRIEDGIGVIAPTRLAQHSFIIDPSVDDDTVL